MCMHSYWDLVLFNENDTVSLGEHDSDVTILYKRNILDTMAVEREKKKHTKINS